MGWYFSRRELGCRPEMTVLSHLRQGIHRETARYIRLNRGVYRYRGCRDLLCQLVNAGCAAKCDRRGNSRQAAILAFQSSTLIQRFHSQ